MPPFLFRCPITGYRVQGFTAEEVSDDDYQQNLLSRLSANPLREPEDR